MKKVSFDELDKKINELSVHKMDWFLHTTGPDYKTPNINDLPVITSGIEEKKEQKRYICSRDTIRRIRNLLRNNAYDGRKIEDDEYFEISDFILGDNVPEEEKIALRPALAPNRVPRAAPHFKILPTPVKRIGVVPL